MVIKLVLVRHGESTWNAENRFTGWVDVPLSEKGLKEAHRAADRLKEAGFSFDVAFTSVLQRAIKTLWTILEDMNIMSIPITNSWRLNERMYGGLQGLDKAETAAKHSEEQVKIWRRSFDVPPPEIDPSNQYFTGGSPAYHNLPPDVIPKTECLKDTVVRFLPFYFDNIVPALKAGKKVLIAAHGNSLRALVKYLDNVSDNEITELNIPTGIPLVYELDEETLRPVKHYYLASDEELKAAIDTVANQGKKK
eukprot:TRINITY_DN1747_c0_g1_i1.p1 TRINITY_DN1747_c0_g1~~TRINITY_DN1747_c0_g1_i1.p1  ORF type:complete len:251 (-),score=46.94 TRINITY_DN1747_c0_g1_i1:612-1364(-)